VKQTTTYNIKVVSIYYQTQMSDFNPPTCHQYILLNINEMGAYGQFLPPPGVRTY